MIEDIADLFEHTKNFFAANGVTSPVLFGWRAPYEQNHERHQRVVFMPGDLTGKAATVQVSPQTSNLGETVTSNGELCTIFVWARDPRLDNQTVDAFTYKAVRRLADNVIAAVIDGAQGRIKWSQPQWVQTPTKTIVAGKELLLSLELRRGIPAIPVTQDVSVVGQTTGYLLDSIGCCDACENP